MTFKYLLDKDIVARTAAQLSWQLKNLPCSVNIRNSDRIINGKSLVGILSAHMRLNDVIEITTDGVVDSDLIREYFNEIGQEV